MLRNNIINFLRALRREFHFYRCMLFSYHVFLPVFKQQNCNFMFYCQEYIWLQRETSVYLVYLFSFCSVSWNFTAILQQRRALFLEPCLLCTSNLQNLIRILKNLNFFSRNSVILLTEVICSKESINTISIIV